MCWPSLTCRIRITVPFQHSWIQRGRPICQIPCYTEGEDSLRWTIHSTKKRSSMLGVLSKSCSSFKSGKAGEKKEEDLLQDLISKCGSHASFVTGPSQIGTSERNLFGINHYTGSCSYDITNFIEKDSDLLNSALVTLLRNSSDGFVSKLISCPSHESCNSQISDAIDAYARASELGPSNHVNLTTSPDPGECASDWWPAACCTRSSGRTSHCVR